MGGDFGVSFTLERLRMTLQNICRFCNEIDQTKRFVIYRISSNKRRASNKCRPLISAAPLGIHIETSASL